MNRRSCRRKTAKPTSSAAWWPPEQAMAVIERLEEIYRVTLMLHYQDGWSIQKIADYMGVPVKTAQKRLERARAKVWREVEKYDAGIADPL